MEQVRDEDPSLLGLLYDPQTCDAADLRAAKGGNPNSAKLQGSSILKVPSHIQKKVCNSDPKVPKGLSSEKEHAQDSV